MIHHLTGLVLTLLYHHFRQMQEFVKRKGKKQHVESLETMIAGYGQVRRWLCAQILVSTAMLQSVCPISVAVVVSYCHLNNTCDLQTRPNFFTIGSSAFPDPLEAWQSGWLDKVMPDGILEGNCMLSHEVLAAKVQTCVNQKQYSEAASILVRGLARGYPDTVAYDKVLKSMSPVLKPGLRICHQHG